ncbi:hypothetical protein KOR42_38530 [Thalassoglobus neptunius]|uniref:Uncharacterized protein n=1 Tax=Thalassoglobus neptunius TaxID=1938619 RepID=A0A5C5WIR5_9PLAN|nr:hypothetical protein KOR42_38530 [Thalassoglobus neptunius]
MKQLHRVKCQTCKPCHPKPGPILLQDVRSKSQRTKRVDVNNYLKITYKNTQNFREQKRPAFGTADALGFFHHLPWSNLTTQIPTPYTIFLFMEIYGRKPRFPIANSATAE